MPPLRSTITGVVVLVCVALILATPSGTTDTTDWNTGDVFVGLGEPDALDGIRHYDPLTGALVAIDDNPNTARNEAELFGYLGKYRVLDANGNFREDVAFATRGVTMGCAVDAAIDPLTGHNRGRLWAANFSDDIVEALGEVHDSRRGHPVLSSFATSPFGAMGTQSVLVGRAGDLYIGVADDNRDYRGSSGLLQYDALATLLKFGRDGVMLARYRIPLRNYPRGFQRPQKTNAPHGINWFDLSTAGILFYTSEDRFVRTWDLVRNQPGPGNAITIQEGTASVTYPPTAGIFAWVTDERAHGIRLLPPGDGVTGGMLVATAEAVRHFNGAGREVAKYGVPATSGYWSVSLSPDARHFWTTTIAGPAVIKFHLATGRPASISPVPLQVPIAQGVMTTVYDRVTPPTTPYGLCVKDEYTAQSAECDVNPANPVCTRVETCRPHSPGDDDGDGFDDAHDPDCVPPVAGLELCDAAGVDEDGNGLVNEVCQRQHREGDPVSFSIAAPRSGDTARVYSASDLPLGISLDPATGEFYGVPLFSAAGTYHVTVTLQRQMASGEWVRSTGMFNWIVMDVPPGS